MHKEKVELLGLQHLPGRLNVEQTATILGFAPHDIPELVRAKLLKPVGSPGQNAVKYYASIEIEALVKDRKWLDKATRVINARWQAKNRKKGDDNVPPSS